MTFEQPENPRYGRRWTESITIHGLQTLFTNEVRFFYRIRRNSLLTVSKTTPDVRQVEIQQQHRVAVDPDPSDATKARGAGCEQHPGKSLQNSRNAHFDVYNEELLARRYGHALWYPEPYQSRVTHIGDVGFIREGRFHALFNTMHFADMSGNPVDMPEGFVPLLPGDARSHRVSHFLPAGPVVSESVQSMQLIQYVL